MKKPRAAVPSLLLVLMLAGCSSVLFTTTREHELPPNSPLSPTTTPVPQTPTRTSMPTSGARASSASTPEHWDSCQKEVHFTVGDTIVWRLRGDDAFFYEAGMTITADGAPDAYHKDDTKGTDYLDNAGTPGNWWGIATGADGEPCVQGPEDPMPGYYVSTTALQDETWEECDPRRYVDASEIRYVVLPYDQLGGARMGDLAVVVNRANNRLVYAILADLGPPRHLGEGSVALAEALGIPSSPKDGGTGGGVIYILFPNSGNGKPRSMAEINSASEELFMAWGGRKQLEACFPQ